MPTVTLTLQVLPDSEALHRVVTVCRRRQLVIESLSYAAGELVLTVSGAPPRLRQIDARLGALVEVLDVEHAAGERRAGVAPTPRDRRDALGLSSDREHRRARVSSGPARSAPADVDRQPAAFELRESCDERDYDDL